LTGKSSELISTQRVQLYWLVSDLNWFIHRGFSCIGQ